MVRSVGHFAVFLCTAAILSAAFVSGTVRGAVEVEGSKPPHEVTQHFASQVYKQLIKQLDDPNANYLFSPMSICNVLGIASLGAKGETLNQMRKVFGSTDDELVAKQLAVGESRPSERAELALANRIYVHKKLCKGDQFGIFEELSKLMYNSDSRAVDFSESETVREKINSWVSEVTNEKIEDLLPSGSIDSMTRLVLVNAIYFKAKWKTQFDEKTNQVMNFNVHTTISGGVEEVKTKEVQMMTLDCLVHKYGSPCPSMYFDSEHKVSIVKFVYEYQYSMILYMPKKIRGISVLEGKVDADPYFLDTLRNRLINDIPNTINNKVSVEMPSFSFSADHNTYDIKSALDAIGVSDLFKAGVADFSGIAGTRGQLYASSFIHKATMDVDETGTEAAAASAMGISLMSMPIPLEDPPIKITVDRPFIFQILQKNSDSSETILFQGRVMDVSKLQ